MSVTQRRLPLRDPKTTATSQQHATVWVRKVWHDGQRFLVKFTRSMERWFALTTDTSLIIRPASTGKALIERTDGQLLGDPQLMAMIEQDHTHRWRNAFGKVWSWNMWERAHMRRAYHPDEKWFPVPIELAEHFYFWLMQNYPDKTDTVDKP